MGEFVFKFHSYWKENYDIHALSQCLANECLSKTQFLSIRDDKNFENDQTVLKRWEKYTRNEDLWGKSTFIILLLFYVIQECLISSLQSLRVKERPPK